MIQYAPVRANRHALGQIESLTSGLTSGLAKQIITEGEPIVRRIVKEERNRYAEALIGGIPFALISALSYLGAKYVVPADATLAKAVAYTASAAAAAGGAWWVVSNLKEETLPPPPAPKTGPTAIDPYIQQASQSIVTAAEPRVRAIVDDEKKKIAQAGMAALPFGIAAIAAFLSTFFLVEPDRKLVKAAGYAGTALLLGAGLWFGLQKEIEAT
jgi:hypothetical protein